MKVRLILASLAIITLTAGNASAYLIKQGDTLSSIAITHNTSIEKIRDKNPNITDNNKIWTGHYLNLGEGDTAKSTPVAAAAPVAAPVVSQSVQQAPSGGWFNKVYFAMRGAMGFENQKHDSDKYALATGYVATGDPIADYHTTNKFTGESAKFAFGANIWEDNTFAVRAEAEKGFFGNNGRNGFCVQGHETYNVDANLVTQNDTWFANAYLDWKATKWLAPYIGVGAGINNQTMSFSRQSGRYFINNHTITDTSFAWNVQAGLAFQATSKLSVDLGWRYSQLGSVEMEYWQLKDQMPSGISPESSFKHKATTSLNEIILGVRYAF